MRQGSDIGQEMEIHQGQTKGKATFSQDFVLDKTIFNNVFEKDIRRVFIYKKAERLAKAIHLITPAFAESVSLRNRIDATAIGIVDAAILSTAAARLALSRELLALSSVLSIARTNGMLSSMNADLISREAHLLLQEVAAYEEPRLFLEDAPTLSGLMKKGVSPQLPHKTPATKKSGGNEGQLAMDDKGHIKDRRDAILSFIKTKGKVSIKDISSFIRGISEKTIQRELSALVASGIVLKQGERRWSTYTLT